MTGEDWCFVAFVAFLLVVFGIIAVGSFIACAHGVIVEGICKP